MEKEYRLSIVIASSTGIYIVDYGIFKGNSDVFMSVMENLNVDDLVAISKVFTMKNNKAIIREMSEEEVLGRANKILANEVLVKALERRDLFSNDFIDSFDEAYESTETPYMRVGITMIMKKGVVSSFVVKDEDPINASTLIHRVYDVRKKRVREHVVLIEGSE